MINRLCLAILICCSILLSGCVTPQLASGTSDQAISIARDYVQNATVYGLNFSVIDSVKDIPYARYSDNENPAAYSNIVHSPSTMVSYSGHVVTLYAWTKKGGMLSKWTITMRDYEPVSVQAESIGVKVGTYGYYDIRDIIPAPGYVFMKESLVPREERYEVKIARDYVSNSSIEEINFTVINDSSEIPYTGDGFKNPSLYSSEVYPPSIDGSDNESIVMLFTWSRKGGELSRWDIMIKDGKVAHVRAYCIATNVGYTMPIHFEEWTPEQGRVFIDVNLENGYTSSQGDHTAEIQVAMDYVRVIKYADMNFTVINSSADIPYHGRGSNPGKYSYVIHSPMVSFSDNCSFVTLYAWASKIGLLSEWNVTIRDGRVVYRQAKSIDPDVGDYESYANEPGRGELFYNESLDTRGDPEEVRIAKEYIANYSTREGLTFRVVSDWSQIPYGGYGGNPANYSAIIRPPGVVCSEGRSYVTLYSWSTMRGVLSEWNVTVEDGRVSHVLARCIDSFVGSYSWDGGWEGGIQEKGSTYIDMTIKEDV